MAAQIQAAKPRLVNNAERSWGGNSSLIVCNWMGWWFLVSLLCGFAVTVGVLVVVGGDSSCDFGLEHGATRASGWECQLDSKTA